MPKFNLRDLFAVVTLMALALGWWVEHRAKIAALQSLQDEKTRLRQVQKNAEILHLMWAEERAKDKLLQRNLEPAGANLMP